MSCKIPTRNVLWILCDFFKLYRLKIIFSVVVIFSKTELIVVIETPSVCPYLFLAIFIGLFCDANGYGVSASGSNIFYMDRPFLKIIDFNKLGS